MIRSFADKALESFFAHGPGPASRRIPATLHRALRVRLQMPHYADRLADLRVPPANRLELLKGDLAGRYSLRVNDRWRLVFRWSEDGPAEVELLDYH